MLRNYILHSTINLDKHVAVSLRSIISDTPVSDQSVLRVTLSTTHGLSRCSSVVVSGLASSAVHGWWAGRDSDAGVISLLVPRHWLGIAL